MSAEIRKLKDGELTVYPQTVGSAVILDDGTTVQDLADDFDPKVLSVAPTITIKKFGYIPHDEPWDANNIRYYVSHPLQNIPGSEFVLIKYASNNYKKIGHGSRQNPKKGWCVAAGTNPNLDLDPDDFDTNCISSNGTYFIFPKNDFTTCKDFNVYLDEKYTAGYGVSSLKGLGIALRIPNPEWEWTSTLHRNAHREGICESIWSEVRRLKISNINDPNGYPVRIGYV